MALSLNIGKSTNLGNYRENNEDCIDVKVFPDLTVAVVADGMGGQAAGEIASKRAVDIIPRELRKSVTAGVNTEATKVMIRRGIVQANEEIMAVQGRAHLRDVLTAVATVDVAPVYEQVVSIDGTEEVFDRLRRGEVDAVTLTSPNIAAAFLGPCDKTIRQRLRDGTTRLVVNSERLAKVLEEEGLPSVVAPDPTVEGLILALQMLRAR